MRYPAAVVLIGLIGASPAIFLRAESTPSPSTAPASGEVEALIAKLGDGDFRARRDAAARLRAIGPAALPALKRAAEDPNPEVQARARQVIRRLEIHHVPGRPRRHGYSSKVNVSMTNGRRAIDVDDGGRTIHITQNENGIDMQVAGEVDGRTVTEHFTARNAEELKSENPEAFAVYQRWSAGIASDLDDNLQGRIVLRNNQVIQVQPPMQLLRGAADDLAQLRDRLQTQMKDGKLTEEQQQRVMDAVDAVELEQFNRGGRIDDPDRDIKRYDDACDALRKTLAELKLPDPGDSLPPPRGARLGISASGMNESGGIVVSHVVPDSRADRLGLQEDDAIHKVNGVAVHDIKDLRRLVTDHPKGLVIEITRDGQEKKLEEK